METDKTTRALMLFFRLLKGERIRKQIFLEEHKIDERTFERDIQSLRLFLSEAYVGRELNFDRRSGSYYLTGSYHAPISGGEVMTLAKILISSRSLRKDEMDGMIGTLLNAVSGEERKKVTQLLSSELDDYVSPKHEKAILKMVNDLNQCIFKRKKIQFLYTKLDKIDPAKEYIVSPLAVIFSEFYFYLIAFIEGKNHVYPAFFRVDRINSFTLLTESYSESLYEMYNVGEMKKCMQFMFAGELQLVKIKCASSALEAVLDRLPNAEIVDKEGAEFIVQSRIFGDGFIRWAFTQIDKIEILEPIDMRYKLKRELSKMTYLYEKALA